MSAPVADAVLRRVLTEQRIFAVVGASSNPERPSYGVMAYLLSKGFSVVPVNPGLAGQDLLGQKVYASLAEVPGPVDVVDIFRTSAAALGVVREAIQHAERLRIKTIWMQLGVINEHAASEAEAAGLTVIMDRCPHIEFERLVG